MPVGSISFVTCSDILCFLACTNCQYIFYRELGIGIVAYSPLGRGFFGSGAKAVDNLSERDIRKVLHLNLVLLKPLYVWKC